MGIDIWMCTGDHKVTAEAIAAEFGIPKNRVVAGAMPQDKVAKIESLEAMGHAVAMVGDGINDSPALARADLGVAIGAGTHVAIEAADMVLVRSNLLDVVVALDLAKVVFRRIRLNFMFALMYNVVAIPYAAGLWYPLTRKQIPPQYAGLAMALSSISVVASSMALRLYKRPVALSKLADVASVDSQLTGSIDENESGHSRWGSLSNFDRTKRRLARMKDSLRDFVTNSQSRQAWISGWGSYFNSDGSLYSQLPTADDEIETETGSGSGLGSRKRPPSGSQLSSIFDNLRTTASAALSSLKEVTRQVAASSLGDSQRSRGSGMV
jgi:haloacid dehalogenase-like hydrolase